MKKSLIALAVASALTVPMVAQADATLYGSMRLLVVDADGSDLDVQDGTSRIGIKGDVDLGIDGVKGIYNFETRLRADTGNFAGTDARLSNIGVTGDFGTALIGRMYTPHWLWTSALTDATWNDAVIGVVNEIALRQPNTMAYITPSVSGFQGALAVVANGGTNGDADITNVAAKYAANGLQLGLSWMTVDGTVDADTVAVAGSYTMDAFKVSARYQDEDDFNGANTSRETTQVGIAYTMDATTLQARFTNVDAQGSDDNDQWAVGVQQMLGSQGRVFLEYADVDAGGLNSAVTSTVDRLSVGYRLDF